jgi:hypothetical protein
MAGNTRLLILRGLAIAFWIACVVLVAVPRSNSASTKPVVTFKQPAQPTVIRTGPHEL